MKKIRYIILSSLILLTLTACGGDDPLDQQIEETNEIEDVTAETTEQTHAFDNLVNEATFSNEFGLQAWNDYKAVVENASLGDITILNEENPDPNTIDGLTTSEMDERFAAIEAREDIFQDETELSETEKMVFHRYPPEENSEFSEVADFLAEISFYYLEDNLMFSSITPGFYTVELDELSNTTDLMNLFTVSELEARNPKIFTIAQMNINGENIQQIMTPAHHTDEDGNENVMAFYFFTKGEEIIQYAYLPFEMVSMDFPTNSILLYYQLMSELETL